jgi:hypothetical protein
MSVNISFDGHSLQTTGTSSIITNTITHAGLPTKRAQYYALSHANASFLPFVEYPTKPITITGTLVSDTIADMDALLDTFDSYFIAQDANLDIDWNGSTRRYIATATNMLVDRPGNLAWANFTVTFTTQSAFGRDTTSTTALTATGRTSANYSDSVTFNGTAPWQLPIATITVTAQTGLAGVTGSYILWGNAGTGQQIYVNRTWTNGDVLVIDCTQKTVTVNGLPVAFSGAFPTFPPGSQTIGYSDNFSTRTFNITVTYTAAYL